MRPSIGTPSIILAKRHSLIVVSVLSKPKHVLAPIASFVQQSMFRQIPGDVFLDHY